MNQFRCEPLAKHHERGAFRCGVPELDAYIRERATQDVRRHVAAVFAMVPVDQPHRLAGYYTLSSASVLLPELPEDVTRKLPRYPVVPAILLGRLARDVGYPGLGRLLLLDALQRAYHHSQIVAAAMVVVDAKSEEARGFYLRHGFRELTERSHRLFLPLQTIANLLAGDAQGRDREEQWPRSS